MALQAPQPRPRQSFLLLTNYHYLIMPRASLAGGWTFMLNLVTYKLLVPSMPKGQSCWK